MIDDNVENRFLLTRTIQRKYAEASIKECGHLETALALVGAGGLDAVVSHRAGEVDGLELLRELRILNPTVPIVMVSGINRTRQALAAGATRFLNYDEWLRLGTVIDEIFATQPWAALAGALTHAIRDRSIVTFDYPAALTTTNHEIEPHLLGETTDGRFVLRGRANDHEANASGYAWETYFLDRMTNLALTERTFVSLERETIGDRKFARVMCQS